MGKKQTKEEIKKANDLRHTLRQHATTIDDRLALCITTVASLERQEIALNAFREGAESIVDWDFVGDLPSVVIGNLDDALERTAKIRGRMNANKEALNTSKDRIKSTESDVGQLTQIVDLLAGIIGVTDSDFQELRDVAEANAKACDACNNTINKFITDTAKRAVILLHDEDIEKFDTVKEACSVALEAANKVAGEPITEKCISGLKFLFTLVTETVKEAVVQYKISKKDSHEAFAELGEFGIAAAGAKDTMRVIDIFLDGLGVVVPYWTYIKPGLHTFAEVYVNASVTRAERMKDEKEGTPKTFWEGFKDGLSHGFEEEATKLVMKVALPTELLTSTLQIIVKAFAEQVVGRMDIEPAQSHPGVELEAYLDELRQSYKAGLTKAQPEAQQELNRLGAGSW